LHLAAKLGAQVPEDLLEAGVVRSLLAQVLCQLAGLALGGVLSWRPLGPIEDLDLAQWALEDPA
jgi:hypothetical protein